MGLIWGNWISNVILSVYMLIGITASYFIVKTDKASGKETGLDKIVGKEQTYRIIYLTMTLFWLPLIIFAVVDAFSIKKKRSEE